MESIYEYIKNTQQFIKYKKIVSECFKLDGNLPNQVFDNNYGSFVFEEFDWLMTEEFWDNVKQIARVTEDNEMVFGVIDPKPIEYYYKHFKYFNWLLLSSDMTAYEYIESLQVAPNANIADAIFYNSKTLTLVPLSKKWAIWADRSYGVCILGIDRRHLDNELFDVINSWKNIKQTKNWISLNLLTSSDKDKFIKLFNKNYRW